MGMEYIVYFVMLLVSLYLSERMRPKPEEPRTPGLGDFEVNTALQDRKIPVLWGKPYNKGPNVVWYGDQKSVPLTEEISGIFSSDEYTTGYAHHLGIHFVTNMGGDTARLKKVWIGDKLAWEGNISGGIAFIDKPLLFGGPDMGTGGIRGPLQFRRGNGLHNPPGYLKTAMSDKCPGYRKVTSLIFQQGYVGTSTYLKQWHFQIQRTPDLLPGVNSNIDNEANPSQMLYEMLKNDDWGMGIPDEWIDINKFKDAATTLASESFGLSLLWDRSKSFEGMIKEILKHIDGVMYVNALTGKFELTLMRATEDINLLPVVDNTNSKRTDFSRPGIDELVNEVKIVYTNLKDRKQRVVQAQDLGLYQAINKQIVTTELNFRGITRDDLAMRVAERSLRTASYPLAKVSLTNMHREFYTLTPGSKFVYNDPELGISNLVMVVLDIDYGSFRKESISVEAVQDVFSIGLASYHPPPGEGEFEEVNRDAEVVDEYKLWEAPFWFNLVNPNQENPELMAPMIMAKDPTSRSVGFKLYHRTGTNPFSVDIGTRRFTPVGTLVYDYGRTPATAGDEDAPYFDLVVDSYDLPGEGFALKSVTDEEKIKILGNNMMVINDEIIAYKTIEYVDIRRIRFKECWRAMLDTTKPHLHKAGDTVWFISLAAATTNAPYDDTVPQVDLKLATLALNGALTEEDTPTVTLSNTLRAKKPYPPALIQINGKDLPDFIGENDDVTVTFNETNRLTQPKAEKEDYPSAAPEANTTYTLNFKDASGVVQQSINGLTVPTYTFTKAQQDLIPGYDTDGAMSVEVICFRDSDQAHYTEEIFYHREKPASVGDYSDMLRESKPFAYWGIEE